jgi:CBS domain-containing protein
MSPRAACRLETLGFVEVYEYHAGKVDWISHCLPVEGERAGEPTAGELARDDVVTCGLDDQVGEVRDRVGRSPYPFALVTSSDGVLLGRLRASTLDCDPSLRAEELMEAGPSTVRPHKTAGGVAGDLAERELRWAVVTSPEGRLIGVASRAELEAAASEWPQPAGGAAR